jgi:hypothetical protein
LKSDEKLDTSGRDNLVSLAVTELQLDNSPDIAIVETNIRVGSYIRIHLFPIHFSLSTKKLSKSFTSYFKYSYKNPQPETNYKLIYIPHIHETSLIL